MVNVDSKKNLPQKENNATLPQENFSENQINASKEISKGTNQSVSEKHSECDKISKLEQGVSEKQGVSETQGVSEKQGQVKKNLDSETSFVKKQKKIKDKTKMVIVTTPQLKSLLKLGNSKSNRVSKEISPKINQYFIEIILPDFLDSVEYREEKLFFVESEMSENKFLPSTKFNILALDFFNKKFPDFKIKFNKEKENFLKFQRICEFRLLNLIQCAQLLKEHCNRQTLHISDWYLAIKK